MNEVSPIQWAIRPLQRYAVFGGRAPRAEYWWFYLGTMIISVVLGLVDKMLGTQDMIGTAFSLAVLVPWLAVSVRRLHDIDRSGWWLLGFVGGFGLFALVAGLSAVGGFAGAKTATGFTSLIVGSLIFLALSVTLLVFMILPGTDGPNRYGADPYGPDHLEEVFA